MVTQDTNNNKTIPLATVREWLRTLSPRHENLDPYILWQMYWRDRRVINKVPFENFELVYRLGLQ